MSITSVVNSVSSVYMVANAAWNVFSSLSAPSPVANISENAYRPSNWANNVDEKELVYINTQGLSNIAKEDRDNPGTFIGYFFDAFLREGHDGAVRITDHPVQGGANISDHAYNLPDKLTLEIFVSDVMDYVAANQFQEYETKSISAYQTLRELKEARQPLSVNTRLHLYSNMLIESMHTADDYKSGASMRCTVTLREIIMATVNTETVSIKKDATDSNAKGAQQSPKTNASLAAKITNLAPQ